MARIKGFTLVEVLLVVIIFGIILVSLLPMSAKFFRHLQLSDASKNLTSLMRYLQNKAILEKETYCIDFDIEKSCYVVGLKIEGDSKEFKEIKSSLISRKNLGASLKIESACVKKEDFIDKDKSFICFYPDGSIDEAEIILTNTKGEDITITTNLTGKINAIEE